MERAEVERLLAESPELRAELAGMTDLSQRFSELADEGIDFDLRAGVMEAIRARAGRETRDEGREPGRGEQNGVSGHPPSANAHLPLSSDQGPGTKNSSPHRRWMPLVLMTCSLALLVAAILPLTMKQDQPLSASNDTIDAPFPMAPGMAATVATDGVFDSGDAGPENGPFVAMQTDAPSESDSVGGFGGGVAATELPSELLQSLAQKGRLNPGELITQLIEVGGEAMLAEYQVVDVRRSFSEVEVLLKDNGIVPLVPEAEGAESEKTESNSDLEEMRVIVVDADPTPLNEALVQFAASPENLEVMVTNLDANSLLPETQEPLENPFAKAGEMSPPPAPAAALGATLPDPGPAQPEARASKMMPQIAMPEKSVAGKMMKPSRKFEDPVLSKAVGVLDAAPAAEPPTVAGNSIVISNAGEVFPALEVAAKNSYNNRQNSLNQTNSINRRSGSRAAVQDLVQQPASQVDLFSQNATNASRAPELLYNHRSTSRMRQLAILVLRPKPMAEPNPKTP